VGKISGNFRKDWNKFPEISGGHLRKRTHNPISQWTNSIFSTTRKKCDTQLNERVGEITAGVRAHYSLLSLSHASSVECCQSADTVVVGRMQLRQQAITRIHPGRAADTARHHLAQTSISYATKGGGNFPDVHGKRFRALATKTSTAVRTHGHVWHSTRNRLNWKTRPWRLSSDLVPRRLNSELVPFLVAVLVLQLVRGLRKLFRLHAHLSCSFLQFSETFTALNGRLHSITYSLTTLNGRLHSITHPLTCYCTVHSDDEPFGTSILNWLSTPVLVSILPCWPLRL